MALRPYTGPLPPLESRYGSDESFGDYLDEDHDLEEANLDSKVQQLLANRACHLPGNNFCQDWSQFIRNNHPVLGILCHHRLHPIRLGQRIVNLIGSISFGLAATNVCFLLHIYYRKSMDEALFRISLQSDSNVTSGDVKELEITYGAVTLWIFGGMLHSVFDISLWFLSACACFLPGGCCENQRRLHSIGSYCVVSVVAILVALTTSLIVLRATYEARLRSRVEENMDDESDWADLYSLQSYNFVLGYLIELVLAYCVHYPIIASIFFSGVLSCGCLPFLGGRPAEVQQELRDNAKAASADRAIKQPPSKAASTTSTADSITDKSAYVETGSQSPNISACVETGSQSAKSSFRKY